MINLITRVNAADPSAIFRKACLCGWPLAGSENSAFGKFPVLLIGKVVFNACGTEILSQFVCANNMIYGGHLFSSGSGISVIMAGCLHNCYMPMRAALSIKPGFWGSSWLPRTETPIQTLETCIWFPPDSSFFSQCKSALFSVIKFTVKLHINVLI